MRARFQSSNSFLRDTRGNVMPIAAAGLIVALGLVGSGVDMSRAYMAKARLQAACDAGVLAGRTAVAANGFDATAEARAKSYFSANFNDGSESAHDTTFVPVSEDSGNTVTARATTQVDTAIMKVFAFRKFDLTVDCTATLGVGNSDVMMVLDTTGSMGGNMTNPDGTTTTRIAGLRTAMITFYDTLVAAAGNGNARIRYGFVPYSSSVNVGRILYNTNPSWLADKHFYSSRLSVKKTKLDNFGPATETTSTDTVDDPVPSSWTRITSNNWKKESDCTANQPGDSNWANNGSSTTSAATVQESGNTQTTTTITTQPQRRIIYDCALRSSDNRWYVVYKELTRKQYTRNISTREGTRVEINEWEFRYLSREMPTNIFKTFASTSTNTGANNGNVSSTWNGCVEERKNIKSDVFGFNAQRGVYAGSDAQTSPLPYDLNIDMAPDASDPDTQWAPMWPQISYRRGDLDEDGDFVPRNGLDEYPAGELASSACPREARQFATMTRSAFVTYANALNATGNTYHDLGMIWGGRLASPDGIFASNVNAPTGNAGVVNRHLIFMTDGQMEPNNQIVSSYGLEYWDKLITTNGSTSLAARHTARFRAVCEAIKAKGIKIWVIAFGTSLTTDLNGCASPNSAFTAANSAQLNAKFQDIAKQVGELRVMQ